MIPPSVPDYSPQKEETQMKIALTVLALVALAAGPAMAQMAQDHCKDMSAQMDKALGQRYDAGAANAKATVKEAMALSAAGKHEDCVKKLEEAAKTAGVTLQMKK
jgi:hypothetical protein